MSVGMQKKHAKKEGKSDDLSSLVELLLDFTNDFIHWFKRIKSFKF